MTTYIIRRLAILPLVMLGLSIMIFAMLQLLDPTERAALYVSDIPKNPAALQAIVEKYGLDQPITVQFVNWLGVGYSFPTFVFGLLVLMLFYATLQWFPPGRLSDWATAIVYSPAFHQYTGMNTVDAILNGRLDIFFDALRHLFLPALTLAMDGKPPT